MITSGPSRLLVLFLFLALLGPACSDDSSPTRTDSGPSDASQSEDGNTSSKLVWTKLAIDHTWGSGVDTSLAVNGSTMGIAYYRRLEDEVVTYCPPSGLTPGADRARPAYDLFYVAYDGTDWGDPVQVDQRIGEDSFGTSLLFNNGEINIGYMGGEVGVTTCSSSDALIANSQDGQSWNIQTLASAGPFAGDSVGAWMSLAADSTGQVHAAYKDVRFGYYEHDGQFKASTLFDEGEVISAQDGTGTFNSLVFDGDDNPVVAFYLEFGEQAIMLGHRQGTAWQVTTLRNGETAPRISLATDGSGNYGLTYYNNSKQNLSFMESSDLSQWNDTIVDRDLTNNGKYSSLAYDSQGNPGISYYTCGPYSGQGTDACDFAKDGLMYAHRVNGKWEISEVDDGSLNRCGTYTSLAFTADDEPVISYQCVGMDVNNEFVDNLKVAHGRYQ